MTTMLLTADNLAFVKAALRNAYPSAKSSFLSEALANSLGWHTHAALLASLRQINSAPAPAIHLDERRFIERLAQLNCSVAGPEPLCEIPRRPQLPNPIWRIFRDGDIPNTNIWFRECQRRNIPYVYISKRRKYVRVEWDCISIDNRHDEAINGEGSRTLLSVMYERFQKLARPRKAFFEGSAFVGHIDTLFPAAAHDIADELFVLLYSAINPTEARFG